MKKLVAIFVVLSMFSLAGCAENSIFCKNKNTVETICNGVIVGGNALIAILPEYSPIISTVQAAIAKAQANLQEKCPSLDVASEAQAELSQALQTAQMAGYRINK